MSKRILYVPLDAALEAIREVASMGIAAINDATIESQGDTVDEQAAVLRAESQQRTFLGKKAVGGERCAPGELAEPVNL